MSRLSICFAALSIVFFISGSCSTARYYSEMIEADAKTVEHCKLLGSFTKAADPGKIFQSVEIERCKYEVLKQAEKSGATHIVWIFEGKTGAGLQAYKCSP